MNKGLKSSLCVCAKIIAGCYFICIGSVSEACLDLRFPFRQCIHPNHIKPLIGILYQTGSYKDSLRDMTLKEYSAAVAAMQKLVPPTYQEQLRKILRQKRSAVLHQMQLLGIDTADWGKVNTFCLDSRIAGKEFRELEMCIRDRSEVGITKSSLLHAGLTDGAVKYTKRAMIIQSHLIKTTRKV